MAKHGLENLVRSASLGSYLADRVQQNSPNKNLSTPEKLRLSFEELGPSFVKLGQLLAQRPDLVPSDYCTEFQKLFTEVEPAPFEEIQKVIKGHFGENYLELFESFEAKTFASGSMAQVHRAILADGTKVVVKIQRPHLREAILEDIRLLRFLARTANKALPELRAYSLADIVEEFATSIQLETDFNFEANNIHRFESAFADNENLVFPKVIDEMSGATVLVMEEVSGLPLSNPKALAQEGVEARQVLKNGLLAYMEMIFDKGIFHGDPHPGNLLVLPNNKIGFIDFGCVGRISQPMCESLMSLFLALAEEDYERIAFEYLDLAPATTGIDVEQFAKSLRKVISPYYGISLRYMNLGRVLVATTNVAAEHNLSLPTELTVFFRSLASLESIGRNLDKDFSFIEYALDKAPQFSTTNYEPKKLIKNLDVVLRDTNGLLLTLPKQLKLLFKRLNSPNHAFNLSVKEISNLESTLDKSSKRVFWGLILASLILAFAIIYSS